MSRVPLDHLSTLRTLMRNLRVIWYFSYRSWVIRYKRILNMSQTMSDSWSFLLFICQSHKEKSCRFELVRLPIVLCFRTVIPTDFTNVCPYAIGLQQTTQCGLSLRDMLKSFCWEMAATFRHRIVFLPSGSHTRLQDLVTVRTLWHSAYTRCTLLSWNPMTMSCWEYGNIISRFHRGINLCSSKAYSVNREDSFQANLYSFSLKIKSTTGTLQFS